MELSKIKYLVYRPSCLYSLPSAHTKWVLRTNSKAWVFSSHIKRKARKRSFLAGIFKVKPSFSINHAWPFRGHKSIMARHIIRASKSLRGNPTERNVQFFQFLKRTNSKIVNRPTSFIACGAKISLSRGTVTCRRNQNDHQPNHCAAGHFPVVDFRLLRRHRALHCFIVLSFINHFGKSTTC